MYLKKALSPFFCLVKGIKDGPGYICFMEKSDKLKLRRSFPLNFYYFTNNQGAKNLR